MRVIKSRRLRWAVHVAKVEKGRSTLKILITKRKEILERPSRRWEDSIRVDFKEIGINTRNWVDSAQYKNYWIFRRRCEDKVRIKLE